MIKQAEKLIQLRDRLRELQEELEHVRREVDGVANDLIEHLKNQEIIRNVPVE
jgi:uncharacterized protein Yka (UPF0111/DUF47 family)